MNNDSSKTINNPRAYGLPPGIDAITISPNPVFTTVNIAYPCSAAGKLDITITDVVGRIVYAENVACTDGNTVQQSIDMSSYQQGVYFVALTLSSEHVVKKIVKL